MPEPEIQITRLRRGWLLQTESRLAPPPAEVFPFFADAGNLEQLTPPSLHFQIRSKLPIEMRAGAILEYRLRLHGMPIFWRTEITEWDPPYRFVDTQVKGPYKWWIHEHQFLVEDGATRAVDRVQYDLPLARLLHPLFVRRDLLKIFRYRAQVIGRLFGESDEGDGDRDSAAPAAAGEGS